jgi:hypothetical protein
MSDVQLLPTDKLTWHEERIRIPLPLADVYARLSNAPLDDLLQSTDTFPAVVPPEPVNDIPFPNPGSTSARRPCRRQHPGRGDRQQGKRVLLVQGLGVRSRRLDPWAHSHGISIVVQQ